MAMADTDELERELQEILAYAQTEKPSRERIASELRELNVRVSGGTDPKSRRIASKLRELIACIDTNPKYLS